MEKVLVTSALIYANGKVHVGHLAGAYLPADIYTRYLRLRGVNVIHISGTDEHGVPITLAAEKAGVSPGEYVDRYYQIIKETFDRLGISFDHFSRTSRPLHHKLAQDFFLKLYEKGFIEKKKTRQFYCPSCKRFLPDRYVEGECPYCGYEEARGDQCERCGRWLEPELLKNPRCKVCGSAPHLRETEHFYFMLNKFQQRLEEWIDKNTHWKENVRNSARGWLKEGLRPRAITRDLSWGVPVPLDGYENKVLYVWFDAPIGYISATIEWAREKGDENLWKEYWKDENTKLIHFIGKDNIVFHTIFWPAMLMGYGDFILPYDVPANDFLNLEGEKISTSRNWAVWGDEFVEEFHPDYLRFYLTLILPEDRDGDYRWDELQERVNQELVNSYGNFVNRTLSFIKKYMGGRIPEPGTFTADDREAMEKMKEYAENAGKEIEKFSFRKALRTFLEASLLANRYFDYQAPWRLRKENPERCKTVLNVCANMVYDLALMSSPFIPFSSRRVEEMLGVKFERWEGVGRRNLKGGETLGEVRVLYSKIEDERIKIQKEKLGKEEAMVKIEDVEKLGLKIGKIEKVERVEGADKLYKLLVDLGDEKRTLVAGLRPYYSEEELEGKLIVVVTRLEPARIRGVESQGMLLAAESDGTVAILVPEKDVKPGAKVK